MVAESVVSSEPEGEVGSVVPLLIGRGLISEVMSLL